MKTPGRRLAIAVCVAVHVTTGCAQGQATSAKPATLPARAAVVSDTNGAGLIPSGFGTLKQDDIAIRLQLPDVMVKLTPLDESVIRTLSTDSYVALRGIAEGHRAAVARQVSQHGLLHGNLWYVSFYGLAPDARFSPLEVTISSAGQDFRPIEVLPVSGGFGEQRLQPRVTQTALYLFDDALDVNQPLVVSFGAERSSEWGNRILSTIERERALVRSRALNAAPKAP